jgi:nucleotide-binding universal stress UspA family protein
MDCLYDLRHTSKSGWTANIKAMFKKILVALDGHPAALSALAPAQALAAAFDGEVRLVSVEWPRSPRKKEWKLTQAAYLDKKLREVSVYLDSWACKLREQGCTVSTSVLPLGSPVTRILDEIESWGADLLVLSTHGRSGLARWLLGSVCEEINRRCSCPVMVVHPPGRQTEKKWPAETGREGPVELTVLL